MGNEKFRILEEAIEYTNKDEEVGNKFNSKRSTVATSLLSEQTDMTKVATRQNSSTSQASNTWDTNCPKGSKRTREVHNEMPRRRPTESARSDASSHLNRKSTWQLRETWRSMLLEMQRRRLAPV